MKKLILIICILLYGQNYLKGQEIWQHLSGLSDQYLWKVYATSTDTIFVVGSTNRFGGLGMIAKSTDGGYNWTKTFTESNNLLKDVAFYNKNIGFVVGENGVIMKTTNSGIDWNIKTTNTQQNLNAIAFTDLNNIWAVGDNGIIIHSTNEGESWQIVDLQITSNLNDIAFRNEVGFIAGNNRQLYKTINSGIVWENEIINIASSEIPLNYYSLSLPINNSSIFLSSGDWSESIRSILHKELTTSWSYESGPSISSYTFINDSIGYSAFCGILTNGGENAINVYKSNEKEFNWNCVKEFYSWNTMIDPYHSDFSTVNDTIIYLVSGNIILKHFPTITTEVEKNYTEKKNLSVKKIDNRIRISTAQLTFNSIEVFDTFGKRVFLENFDEKISEENVNISNYSTGVYLVKVTFDNKTTETVKIIKN